MTTLGTLPLPILACPLLSEKLLVPTLQNYIPLALFVLAPANISIVADMFVQGPNMLDGTETIVCSRRPLTSLPWTSRRVPSELNSMLLGMT